MKPTAPPYLRAALRHLRRSDPILAGLIRQIGPYRMVRRPERFQALVRAIVFQQLAGRAAQAIYDRFVALFPDAASSFPSPEMVLAIDEAAMRSAGLSRQKLLYIRDLARHVADGEINFHRFAKMDDEAIIEHLTRVRGIGRWTAEMFLMFNLGRPDVFPVDDLGVRNAIHRAYKMEQPPTRKELREFGERWRPYRSVAVWYLWQSVRLILPGANSRPRPAAARKRAG
jgi:3-methyladenine DNA glycosylase/8-oxoguanine DNA glycosylase